MHVLFDIQRATRAARQRTGDAAISTQAKAGLLQVGRATYPAGKSVGDFKPITDWLPIPDAIHAIEAL